MTQDAAQEPLWTDERIHQELATDASFNGVYGEGIMIIGLDDAIDVVRRMRDELEAYRRQEVARIAAKLHGELSDKVEQIDALQREVARLSEWVPVPSGTYEGGIDIPFDEEVAEIGVFYDDHGYVYAELPDDLRLCQRKRLPE